jgi:3-hydroxybutyryl-CoA dehydrogenase
LVVENRDVVLIRRAAVVGSGAMGAGIAQVIAQAKVPVAIHDVSEDNLANAVQQIEKFIRRGAEKGSYSEAEADETIDLISTTTDLGRAVQDADIVIEAIFEDMEVKQALLRDLEQLTSASTILASNTSSLSVSEMGTALNHRGRIVGMHFFNPAPLMRLVEVVRGAETDDETLQVAVEFSRKLGKTPVVCTDSPNFIVNRVSRPVYYEAGFLFSEGTPAQSVDAAMRKGAGHRMGPLELLDMTGLATHLASSETAFREFGDPKYRPVPLVRRLVRAGHVGRKAGRGFYDYPDGATPTPRTTEPEVPQELPAIRRVAVIGDRGGPLSEWLEASNLDVERLSEADLGSPLEADLVLQVDPGLSSDDARSLFERLGELKGTDTILATGSSFASVAELSSAAQTPDVVGVHQPLGFRKERFFEVQVVPYVTSNLTIARATSLLKEIDAEYVVLAETPAQVVHRIIASMINEAAFAYSEGVASVEDIDTAMRLGMNHPMGPFELADHWGVENVLLILGHLQREFGDPRYRPAQILRRMVRAGRIGKGAGRGFYDTYRE